MAVREHADPERLVPDARATIGLRNRIVHGYDIVDDALIWRVVQDKVPAIKAQIEAALNATTSPAGVALRGALRPHANA